MELLSKREATSHVEHGGLMHVKQEFILLICANIYTQFSNIITKKFVNAKKTSLVIHGDNLLGGVERLAGPLPVRCHGNFWQEIHITLLVQLKHIFHSTTSPAAHMK